MIFRIAAILIILFCPVIVRAYVGHVQVDGDLAFSTSSSEYNNGAQAKSLGFAGGYYLSKGKVELVVKKLSFVDDLTNESGTFDITIDDFLLALLYRVDLHTYLNSKFGIAIHKIEAKYIPRTGSPYTSNIDGIHKGLVLGGGTSCPVWSSFDIVADFTYYLISAKISFFSLEAGIRYSF